MNINAKPLDKLFPQGLLGQGISIPVQSGLHKKDDHRWTPVMVKTPPISYAKLWYMCQVAFPQLLFINVVIYVYGLTPNISSKLLDEFPRHARSSEVSCEPMPAAVRGEMLLHAF